MGVPAPGYEWDTLEETLRFAVPPRIVEIAAEMGRLTDSQRLARVSRCAMTVSTGGDALQWPSRKGRTPLVLSALIDGLAMAAFEPDGVTWRGQHWCTRSHADCPRSVVDVQLPEGPA